MAEMSFNTLESFIAYVKNINFARSNRFEVFLFPPQSMMSAWGDQILRLQAMVEDTALPGRTIETSRLRIHALTEQRAHAIDFFGEAINFTFYVDNTWDIKGFFEDWQNLMIDPNTREVGFYSDYIGQVVIRALSIDESVTHSITLEEAFPRSFQLVQVAQGANSVQRFVVAMAFKSWHQNPVDRSNLPSVGTLNAEDNSIAGFINSKIMATIKSIPLIIESKIGSTTTVLREPLSTITRILGR